MKLYLATILTHLLLSAPASAQEYEDYQDYADYGAQQDNLYHDYAERQDTKKYVRSKRMGSRGNV
jgi:hypothetical protein